MSDTVAITSLYLLAPFFKAQKKFQTPTTIQYSRQNTRFLLLFFAIPATIAVDDRLFNTSKKDYS
jgi:hypothetical protein